MFLVMVMMMLISNVPMHERVNTAIHSIGPTAIFSMIYAVLVSQVLFGDLYNPRLCNALHAMPLRRECWFTTHVVSGLIFALVPHLIVSLLSMTMLGNCWNAALWWLLGASFEYLFFFGLATFSIFCVGNRFAQILIYGILNFLSLLAYWFLYTLYLPLLKGIHIRETIFTRFCPVYQLTASNELLQFVNTNPDHLSPTSSMITIGEGWGYMSACAVIGAALLGLALLLYRRRKLESAGDFMAVKAMEPVFLVLYTLSVGAFCEMFATLFGMASYIYLAIGIVIGFFTGRMLLRRTTRVFQKKAFVGLAVLSGVLILSLLLTKWDILGAAAKIPEIDQIEYASISNYYNYPHHENLMLTEKEDLEDILYVHEVGVRQRNTKYNQDVIVDDIAIHYTLKNGRIIERHYLIPIDSEAGKALNRLFSKPEYVLKISPNKLHDLINDGKIQFFIDREADMISREEQHQLIDAIIADCNAGNMAQRWGYHELVGDASRFSINIQYTLPNKRWNHLGLDIFDSCKNTLTWLDNHSLLPDY